MNEQIKSNEIIEKTKSKQTSDKNGITNGVIWKQILYFFFPILIGAFFQTLYNTVDAAIVGQFAGKLALASVGGSSGQMLDFVFSFFMGLSTGATVIIAQYFGAEEYKKVDDALHTAYTFALVGGIVLGIISIFLTRPFLRLLKTPENLMDLSTIYMRTLFSGLVLALIFNIGSGILRAIGDSKRPLYILMACAAVNIVLDLIFVKTLHMGVLGAGIATNIAQFVSAIMVTWLLMKRTPGLQLSLKRLHITPKTLGKILRIGLPTAIAGSMFNVANMIIQSSLNLMGVNTVAAWTAYGRIDALWWMINRAFSISITTFVGQNFGAAKTERIKKAVREVLAMEICSGMVMSASIVTFAPFLLRFFADSNDVIAIGIQMSRIIAPAYAVYAIVEILASTLRAENYVYITTIVNLLGVCVYRIVWVKFIVPNGSLKQILLCYPISWTILAVFMVIYYIVMQPKILKRLKSPNAL